MIRFFLVLFFGLFNCAALAQSKLKPGFDAKEFIDVLHLEWAHQDSLKYRPPSIPKNYKRVYRSPEVGLNNKFDFWLRDDSVGVICVRYTVGGSSWLENFYSGMIKATGKLKLNDSTTVDYKFSNDDKALTHHGWTIGVCHLAPYVTKVVNEYRAKGVKEFIIVGHSQGSALAFLLRSYLEYAPAQVVAKDVTYKLYACAAPKPGNHFYAYDFDFITRNGWAYRIVNAADWVPETPFTIQSINDLNPLNPFAKRKEIMKKRTNPLISWYVNHAINDMDKATRKVNRKYHKYLTRRMGKFIKKQMKQYQPADVETKNAYASTGVPIILQPNEIYHQKFNFDGKNILVHHMFEAYIYLTELYYLK